MVSSSDHRIKFSICLLEINNRNQHRSPAVVPAEASALTRRLRDVDTLFFINLAEKVALFVALKLVVARQGAPANIIADIAAAVSPSEDGQ